MFAVNVNLNLSIPARRAVGSGVKGSGSLRDSKAGEEKAGIRGATVASGGKLEETENMHRGGNHHGRGRSAILLSSPSTDIGHGQRINTPMRAVCLLHNSNSRGYDQLI